MYKNKLRRQSRVINKNKNQSIAVSKAMESQDCQTTAAENIPKFYRLTNFDSVRSSKVESPFKFVEMIDRRFEKLAE